MNSASESLIVAVDGGGSNCRACVFDQSGTALGQAVGGSANVTTDLAEAFENISLTVRAAYADAGLAPKRMSNDVGFLGLAGATIGTNAKQMEAKLEFARVQVASDRDIAIQGALGEGDGTVAQVGTGSFFSVRRDGQLQHVGGWGFQLSDDCSGANLGRDLLRACIAAHDRLAPASALTKQILARFEGEPAKMVQFARTATPRDYGAFAKDIVVAHEAGDLVAKDILETATQRMVQILDRLDALRVGPIYLLGGLSSTYLALLPSEYREACQTPKGSPLDGAFAVAQQTFFGGCS